MKDCPNLSKEEVFVVKQPSEKLLRFVNKLGERQMENLRKLRNRKNFSIKITLIL